VAPEWWPWGFNEELLASLIEQVDLSNRLYVQAHSKPGTQPPRPVQIPRPYDRVEQKPRQRRRATPEEIIDMFSQGGGRVVTDAPS